MDKSLLTIKNLKINFYNEEAVNTVVNGLALQVNEGEILALVGSSGSGKTITALSIIRLLPVNAVVAAGEIIFNGRDLLSLPEAKLRELRGREIGFVFQEPLAALNPVFTIGFQIKEALRFHTRLNNREIEAEALRLLGKAGIPDPQKTLRDFPHQLSAGLRQRAMIAQAIASRPKLLIADEPTSNLDVTVQAKILELFLSLKNEMNLSILLITHDLALVEHFADRVAVISGGRIVEFGQAKEILNNPQDAFTRELVEAIKLS